MLGDMNFVIINGDEYIDGVKKHLDILNSEFYNHPILHNCKCESDYVVITFTINKNKTTSIIEVESELSLSQFEVQENHIEDFIFGIIASCLEIYGGGLLDIRYSVLKKNTTKQGEFYLNTMNDKISILGNKEVFVLVEGKCGIRIIDANSYFVEIESILDDDSTVIGNFIINSKIDEHSEEKIYLYVKDKL